MAARKKAGKSAATKKNLGGRPTKYKRAVADKLCKLLGEGQSLITICRDNDDLPSESTVRKWVLGIGIPEQDKLQFRADYAIARDLFSSHVFDRLHTIDVDTVNEQGRIQLAKLWSDNMKWGLARMDRGKYGDKSELSVGGTGTPVEHREAATLDHMTEDEQRTLRELSRKAITGKKQ